MSDLVVTCPRLFWEEWIDEGDAAGDPEDGTEWAWFTGRSGYHNGKIATYKPPIKPGERLYVVAWGKLRGYAIVTDVREIHGKWAIIRRGGAQAVTIPQEIRGFQGWRYVWWKRADEVSFPDWKTAGVP